MFEVVPARDFQAVATLADAVASPAEADMTRLVSAAQQEHKQNKQTQRLMTGNVVRFGARVQVREHAYAWLWLRLSAVSLTTALQFRHVKSGKWLTVRPRKVSTVRKDHTLVELDDWGNPHAVFVLHPRYKHRQFVRACVCPLAAR